MCLQNFFPSSVTHFLLLEHENRRIQETKKKFMESRRWDVRLAVSVQLHRMCVCVKWSWMLGFSFAKFKTCFISQQIISTIGLFGGHICNAAVLVATRFTGLYSMQNVPGNRLSHFYPFHIPLHHKFNDTYIVQPMIFIAITIHAYVRTCKRMRKK